MTTRKTPQVPEPVAVTTVCSMCGLDWKLHGKTPTTEDCIRLLKLELARRPHYVPPVIIPQPYPVVPYRPPYQPWWGTTSGGSYQTVNCSTATPTVSSRSPHAVSA